MKSKESGKINTDFYEITIMPCLLKYMSLAQKKGCQQIT